MAKVPERVRIDPVARQMWNLLKPEVRGAPGFVILARYCLQHSRWHQAMDDEDKDEIGKVERLMSTSERDLGFVVRTQPNVARGNPKKTVAADSGNASGRTPGRPSLQMVS